MKLLQEQCADFIALFEGFVDHAYKCPAGIETFGYGSSLANYPGTKFPISKEAAMTILQMDLEWVLKCMDLSILEPINPNQTIALSSFIYNVGAGNFHKSTMRKLINLNRHIEAADEFPKWCHIGRTVSKGLSNRRILERKMFLTKVITNDKSKA